MHRLLELHHQSNRLSLPLSLSLSLSLPLSLSPSLPLSLPAPFSASTCHSLESGFVEDEAKRTAIRLELVNRVRHLQGTIGNMRGENARLEGEIHMGET